MARMRRGVAAAACALALVWVCGCGGEPSDRPDLGKVSGKVTLDGEPLADAVVRFIPTSGAGRPSFGTTNAQGQYYLSYTKDGDGAVLGPHAVRVSTYRAPDVADDGTPVPGAPERVPQKYTGPSTDLTAEVKPGKNENIDFALKTDGGKNKVVQPPPPE